MIEIVIVKCWSTMRIRSLPRSAVHTVGMGLLESRPLVQVMFVSRFLAGAVLTGGVGEHGASVVTGTVAWFSASVSVYVFNGVMDVAEDRANRSRRPIASGRLPRANTLVFMGCATVLALGLGTAVGIVIDVALFLGLGYLYSGPPLPAKRSGPAASAVITGLGLTTFWAGAHTAQGSSPDAVVFGLVMSGWMGLVGALAKDIGDVPGDALAGRRTFAVRYGIVPVARSTAVLAVVVGAAGIAASALTAPILLPSMLVLAICSLRLAGRCRSLAVHSALTTTRDPYRTFMAAQYAVTGTLGITLLAHHAI